MKEDQKPDLTTTEAALMKPHKSLVLPIIGIIAAIGLLLMAWWVADRPTPQTPQGQQPTSALTPALPPAPTQAQIDAFIQSEVLPALAEYDSRNKAAVDRAVDRISNGVLPGFACDFHCMIGSMSRFPR